MTTIRGVLFDYGLVLSGPPDPEAWERLKTLLAAEETPFHQAYWSRRHDYDLGVLNSVAYWKYVGTTLDRDVSDETVCALELADLDLWTRPNHEMIAWASALQQHGVRTALLSNIGDAMETGVRARCPWLARFDPITFSHRLRLAKPDPEIYRHAAEGIGLPRHEVLFVDDREDNIAAAKAFGMQALQYVDHGQFIAQLRALAGESLPLPEER